MSRKSAFRERLNAAFSVTRFGRFVAVGIAGTICDFLVLLVLSQTGTAAALATTLGISSAAPEVAKVTSIESAVIVMFLLNEWWTFDDIGSAGSRAFLRRFGKSHLARTVGIAVQLAVFSAVYRLVYVDVSFQNIDLWLLVASGCGIVVGMGANFVTESLFTWRVQDS